MRASINNNKCQEHLTDANLNAQNTVVPAIVENVKQTFSCSSLPFSASVVDKKNHNLADNSTSLTFSTAVIPAPLSAKS